MSQKKNAPPLSARLDPNVRYSICAPNGEPSPRGLAQVRAREKLNGNHFRAVVDVSFGSGNSRPNSKCNPEFDMDARQETFELYFQAEPNLEAIRARMKLKPSDVITDWFVARILRKIWRVIFLISPILSAP